MTDERDQLAKIIREAWASYWKGAGPATTDSVDQAFTSVADALLAVGVRLEQPPTAELFRGDFERILNWHSDAIHAAGDEGLDDRDLADRLRALRDGARVTDEDEIAAGFVGVHPPPAPEDEDAPMHELKQAVLDAWEMQPFDELITQFNPTRKVKAIRLAGEAAGAFARFRFESVVGGGAAGTPTPPDAEAEK